MPKNLTTESPMKELAQELDAKIKAWMLRAVEITGHTTNIDEAFDEWELERQALSELHEGLQTLEFQNYRMGLALDTANSLILTIEKEAEMFIKQKTRDKIQQFKELFEKAKPTAKDNGNATTDP